MHVVKFSTTQIKLRHFEIEALCLSLFLVLYIMVNPVEVDLAIICVLYIHPDRERVPDSYRVPKRTADIWDPILLLSSHGDHGSCYSQSKNQHLR